MTAVISTTKDDMYFFCLPIVAWAWSKNGIKTLCFVVDEAPLDIMRSEKMQLVKEWVKKLKLDWYFLEHYIAAEPHKCATYAQCSRLFASSILPSDELIITSDIDMCAFFIPNKLSFDPNGFLVLGADLTEIDQFPMCYIVGNQPTWEKVFCPEKDAQPQHYLDHLVGTIECQDFRGNQWCLDQFTARKMMEKSGVHITAGTRRTSAGFASNRVDRDDINFMHSAINRPLDYHMHRPGYLPDNAAKIADVLNTTTGGANWIYEYAEQYLKLVSHD